MVGTAVQPFRVTSGEFDVSRLVATPVQVLRAAQPHSDNSPNLVSRGPSAPIGLGTEAEVGATALCRQVMVVAGEVNAFWSRVVQVARTCVLGRWLGHGAESPLSMGALLRLRSTLSKPLPRRVACDTIAISVQVTAVAGATLVNRCGIRGRSFSA